MSGPLAGIAEGALEPDFYREFISRLGVDISHWPEQDDRERWAELRGLIDAAIAARTQAEWAKTYEGSDACVTPVLTFDEAAEHPHNAQRQIYRRIAGALHPSPAPRLSRTPARATAHRAGRRPRAAQFMERGRPSYPIRLSGGKG